MFRQATLDNTPRARQQEGHLVPMAVPYKGLNTRAPYASMGKEFAISLQNVVMETYGVRTRKGSAEWATGIPGGTVPIPTMMVYYPASLGEPAVLLAHAAPEGFPTLPARPQALVTPPIGKLFAAKGGNVYDVTAGGSGPFVAQVGVSGASDYWTWINFQNLAGSFLVATNDSGGYAYYNGSVWTTPTMGSGAGQINGANPANFAYVMEFGQRLWFIEKNSTRAWYLPVNQVVGTVTLFDFGQQMPHGGPLAAMSNWTIDAGDGMDDNLVAVGCQGDVIIYQGFDPSSTSTFGLKGKWYCGDLPVGRRQMSKNGGDVYILSTLGIVPVSRLMQSASLSVLIEQESPSNLVSPLIGRLMRDYSKVLGWQLSSVLREELLLVGVPVNALTFSAEYLAYKETNPSWSTFNNTKYRSFVSVGAEVFAGTSDGRVLRAFTGVLDDVSLAGLNGQPIVCQVTPAYQPLGDPGLAKRVMMIRPTFLASLAPQLTFKILTDFNIPQYPTIPTTPPVLASLWNTALWNSGIWGGIQTPFKSWIGAAGEGFTGTAQLDYACGGDTILSSLDFWVTQGGPL